MVGRIIPDGIKPVEATIGSKRFELEELVADATEDGDTVVLGAEPVPTISLEDAELAVVATELSEDSED